VIARDSYVSRIALNAARRDQHIFWCLIDKNTFTNHLPMQKVSMRPDPTFIGVFANQPLTGDSLETQSALTDSVLRDRPAVDRPSSHANKNEHGSHRNLDARITRHVSRRWVVEKAFGWLKETSPLRQVKPRGLPKVNWLFVFNCAAHNLIRFPRLIERQSA
jgi:hypothetical protein